MGQKVIFKVPLSINSVLEAEKSSTQHWHILNMIKTYRSKPQWQQRDFFGCIWDEERFLNRILWLKLHLNFLLNLKLA